MRKISIFLLAALAMLSCGNSYKAQDAQLTNESDSVNYALGLLNGLQIKMYYLANDSSDEAVAEFIDALDKSYLDKEEKLSDIAQAGRQFGSSVKTFETKGLAENEAWTLNEKLFFQGVVNALLEDTTMMSADEAEAVFMASYQSPKEADPKAKVVYAKCGKKAKTLDLKTNLDSLNYAFGFLNGGQIKDFLQSLSMSRPYLYQLGITIILV